MSSTTKEKRRNSEKRKEKSRDAARFRRGKETEIFYELAHQLPLPHNVCAQLDKAAIMRLTISFLKMRMLIGEKAKRSESKGAVTARNVVLDKMMDSYYLKALEGFVMVLTQEGDMAYLSENVSKYLGLTQVDMAGHSIYDYTHPCDHEEIREQLSDKPGLQIKARKEKDECSFLVRMKCTLTPKGRNVNLKSATYKVIQCRGHMKTAESSTSVSLMGYRPPPMTCLILVAEPIPHPANIEIPLDSQTFLSRHSMDMKFTYVDDRIQDIVGYKASDLIGKSAYDFCHALDTDKMEKSYQDLYSKGQTSTRRYRFLSKNGGYVWIQTQATVIYNNRTSKPQCIVSVNYVLSGIENENLVLSTEQKKAEQAKPKLSTVPEMSNGMKLSTEEIFSPLSEDSNACFWTSTGDKVNSWNPDPDELPYLAPTAGPAMIPLPFSGGIDMDMDMYDEVLFPTDQSVPNFTGFDPFTSTTVSLTGGDSKSKEQPNDPSKPQQLQQQLPQAQRQELQAQNDVFSQHRAITAIPTPPASVSPHAASTCPNSPEEYKSYDPTVNGEMVDKVSSLFTTYDPVADDNNLTTKELEMRAPYIPMTGGDCSLYSGKIMNDPVLSSVALPSPPHPSCAAGSLPSQPRIAYRPLAKGVSSPTMVIGSTASVFSPLKPPCSQVSSKSTESMALSTETASSRPTLTPSLITTIRKRKLTPPSFATQPPTKSSCSQSSLGEQLLFGMRPVKTEPKPHRSPTGCQNLTETTMSQKKSSLLNLLLNNGGGAFNGCDSGGKHNGQKMPSLGKPGGQSTSQLPGMRIAPLLDVTRYDAEVNAPIQSTQLLQGEDLLRALDQSANRVPSPSNVW
uniref:Hypoxia-inducible factor 1 n=1 Tax=Ptychodera bahamensis TaxID=117501 RepID=A0AA96HF38_9BILA|nr:hypoxia-inducible factor 1 [Ptychodera bahamensis]